MYRCNNLTRRLFLVIVIIYTLLCQASCNRMDLPQITERIKPRIVQMVVITQETKDESPFTTVLIGTGFIVNNDGYVITAGHNIDMGELYIEQAQADVGELGLVIPPPPGITGGSDPPQPQRANHFEVVARDDKHDLALLKIKMTTDIVPSIGETLQAVYYDNFYGTLNVGNARFTKNISQNISIAVTGYTSDQFVTETRTGQVTSKELTNIIDSRLTVPSSSVSYSIADYFNTDINSTPGLSGSPVYSTRNGDIMGICINLIQDESGNSGITAIIPSRYILSLLESNNVR